MMSEDDLTREADLQPQGARFPEYVCRDLLSFGFTKIRADMDKAGSRVIDEVFAQLKPSVRLSIKNWLRDLTNLKVEVNWPPGDMSFPWIACVQQSVADGPQQYLNNRLGTQRLGTLGNTTPKAREAYGTPLQSTVQFWIFDTDPDRVSYLFWIVWYILRINADALAQIYDIQDITLSGQDIKWEEGFLPVFSYIRMLQMSHRSEFDFSTDETNPLLIQVALQAAVRDPETGELVSVEVPLAEE